jgi:hypothetical protein
LAATIKLSDILNMKKAFFIIIILNISFSAYSQTQILAGYNFENANYVLYGWPLYSRCNKKNIVDSLYRWYVNDNKAISEISTLWNLKERPVFDLLVNDFDYEIYLYKDKIRVETFFVNSQNWVLYHKNKSYYFGEEYLRIIAQKTNEQRTFSMEGHNPYDSSHTYHREIYDTAMAFYNNCLNDPEVMFIMESNVPAGEYEGDFMFTYKLKNIDLSLNIKDLEKRVTSILKKKYKKNRFYIEFEEIDDGSVNFWISCGKKMYDNFTLYPKVDRMSDEDYWNDRTYRTLYFPTDQNKTYY